MRIAPGHVVWSRGVRFKLVNMIGAQKQCLIIIIMSILRVIQSAVDCGLVGRRLLAPSRGRELPYHLTTKLTEKRYKMQVIALVLLVNITLESHLLTRLLLAIRLVINPHVGLTRKVMM